MKKILICIVLFLIPSVVALSECNNIYVVKFNYDNGAITYKDKAIKCGYAPDMKIQPAEGYILRILSIDNSTLHSFRFDIPLKMNVDLSDPLLKNLYGG